MGFFWVSPSTCVLNENGTGSNCYFTDDNMEPGVFGTSPLLNLSKHLPEEEVEDHPDIVLTQMFTETSEERLPGLSLLETLQRENR